MWIFLAGEFLTLSNKVVMRWIRLIPTGYADIINIKRQGRPVIFVGWHGHNFINIGVYLKIFGRDSRTVIMVRNNLRGYILAHFARRRKISVVFLGKNPNSFKWARGVAKVIEMVMDGYDALIAIDGADGLAFQVRSGAALMAKRSSAVLVPAVVSSNWQINLPGRRDKHLIPLPGARTVVHYGPIIDPLLQHSAPSTLDELREKIAEALVIGMRREKELR